MHVTSIEDIFRVFKVLCPVMGIAYILGIEPTQNATDIKVTIMQTGSAANKVEMSDNFRLNGLNYYYQSHLEFLRSYAISIHYIVIDDNCVFIF